MERHPSLQTASMVFLQPYDDVPGIDTGEDDPLVDENRTFSGRPGCLSTCWNPLNIAAGGLTSFLRLQSESGSLEQRLSYLGSHTASDSLSLHKGILGEAPVRPTSQLPWEPQDIYPDVACTIRYMSPGGPMGGDLSTTDPDWSRSECSWSPQTSRDFPCSLDGQPDCLPTSQSSPNHDGNYWSGSSLPIARSPQGTATGHSSVALKELQRFPDFESDDLLGYKSEVKVEGAYSPPVEILHDAASFHDEALGNSVLDEDYLDDTGCNEDAGSVYSPTTGTRWSSQTTRVGSKPGGRKQQARDVQSRSNSRVSSRNTTGRKRKGVVDVSSTAIPLRRKTPKGETAPTRPFACSFSHYGCNSTFGSKNEWKRHVMSQHLQLGFYRCDVGPCVPGHGRTTASHPHARTHNDFNRKDLFTQHQRRMHCPWSPSNRAPSAQQKEAFEHSLEAVRQRCWRQQRTPPDKSVCGFCDRVFEGPSTWDERMEHVGKHLEKGDIEEKEDEELREWALQEGIIAAVGHGRFVLANKEDVPRDLGEEDAEGEDE